MDLILKEKIKTMAASADAEMIMLGITLAIEKIDNYWVFLEIRWIIASREDGVKNLRDKWKELLAYSDGLKTNGRMPDDGP